MLYVVGKWVAIYLYFIAYHEISAGFNRLKIELD